MVEFGHLSPDGKYTFVRNIPQAKILECKFAIMAHEHYRNDGSCKCDDPEHREFMKREWEYTGVDFDEIS